MKIEQLVAAQIALSLDAALETDWVSVPELASTVTTRLLGEYTIQPRGSVQGDAHPRSCGDCPCMIPCASATCRYPLVDGE